MADSAPDPKVEDVLSSVRRLVSQEIPKRPAPQAPPASAGALVLTSKDRIEADPKARVEQRSLEQRIAELEAAVDSTAHEFEPDGSEDQSLHRPDRIVYTRPRPSEEGASRPRSTLRLSEIALIETGPANESDGDVDTPVAFRHEDRSEAPMAEDVPTLPAASAELHAFSDPDDVVARIEARIERGEAEPEPASPAPVASSNVAERDERFDAALTAAVAASLKKEAEDEADDAAEHLADTLSAEEDSPSTVSVETVDPEALPDQEPQPISGPAEVTRLAMPAVDTIEFADDVDEAPTAKEDAEPEAEVTVTAADEALDGVDEADAAPNTEAAVKALGSLPDEDALRLLVSRLLREELRGELGERITQNVRKLVRREILRALESRNLD